MQRPLATFATRVLLWGAAAALGGCASLPALQPPPPTHALTDVEATPLARLAAGHRPPQTPADHSGVRLLSEAAFALDARIALARRATRSLDVQYYLLQNDDVGHRLLRELRDAAARGVRVRLIVDDLYNGGEDELFNSFASHPGVEVRLFNPLPARGGGLVSRVLRSVHEFGRINHRMHNKLFIADNSFSVSGGRNVAQEYFMASGQANFIDMDVLATGPAVREQSASFDAYWNSPQVYPITQVMPPRVAPAEARRRFDEIVGLALPDPPLRERDVLGRSAVSRQLADGRLALAWAPVQVFADDPAKITRDSFETRFAGSVTERTLGIIRSARERVVIISPYFIPGDIGMDLIRESAARGVVTVVLTNSLGATDEPLVYARYARYRDDMLRLGVVIHEFGPMLSRDSRQYGSFGDSLARLHAKMAVVDQRRMFVGSMNLDGRSASLNTEIGLLIESPELITDFDQLKADRFTSAYQLRLGPTGDTEWIERDAEGRETVHTDEPHANWFLEFKNWLVSPFVREELL